jgi:hypothetical protein
VRKAEGTAAECETRRSFSLELAISRCSMRDRRQ